MAHPSPNPFRIYILTASVAAITATGAWYGAGLKTRQEFRRVPINPLAFLGRLD